ncbi:MAG: F0F1 ATP synthase subunit B' [Pseudomonadota bacterium]
MAEAPTTTGTEAPHKTGGFPPFDTTTFPSQLFWLVVTFAFLFVVMWRVAGPRINGVITSRRGVIHADIAAAEKARTDAEAASSAYQTALASARARAQGLAEENRQALNGEIAKAKTVAETEAANAMAAADARISASRVEARSHVIKAAEEAAIAIVARLTGETVSPVDAAQAVKES